jgi:hypothetical protein
MADRRGPGLIDWLGMIVPRPFIDRVRRQQVLLAVGPPAPEDLEVLEDLRQQGSRLDLPHPVRAFCELGSESSARDVAARLAKEGYTCSVRAVAEGVWTVTAVVSVVPTLRAIAKVRYDAEKAVGDLGGRYRGWTAPVVY